MKSYFLFTGTGPKVILTSYDSVQHPQLLKKLESKGILKFIAYEVSIESTIDKLGKYFDNICDDLSVSDDFRMIEYSTDNISKKFDFSDLRNPTFWKPNPDHTMDIYMVGV